MGLSKETDGVVTGRLRQSFYRLPAPPKKWLLSIRFIRYRVKKTGFIECWLSVLVRNDIGAAARGADLGFIKQAAHALDLRKPANHETAPNRH